MDFSIEEPHLEWTGEGIASASDGLTTQGGKSRGGCTDDLNILLSGEWQESAGVKGKLLALGYGLATVSRAASQLVLTGEMQQDKRGRLTFWRKMPLDVASQQCVVFTSRLLRSLGAHNAALSLVSLSQVCTVLREERRKWGNGQQGDSWDRILLASHLIMPQNVALAVRRCKKTPALIPPQEFKSQGRV